MSKSKYSLLLAQAESLLSTERDQIANAANLASLIFYGLDDLNWAGFYFFRNDELVLGPFCGKVACTRIPLDKGVCGGAFTQQKTLLVDDVHLFPGHIACDSASQSEIVVPFKTDSLSGVLDIDSPEKGRFGEEEKSLVELLAKLYSVS